MGTPRVRGSIANGTSKDRDRLDFYETPQGFTREMLRRQHFGNKIWEPAAGAGAISDVLRKQGYEVLATDISPRNRRVRKSDFFEVAHRGFDIVTNPPFKLMTPFIVRGFELCRRKMAVVMPISGLNSSGRFEAIWSKFPVSHIYLAGRYQHVKSERGLISSQYTHIWVIFDKKHRGPTRFEWFPNVVYVGE